MLIRFVYSALSRLGNLTLMVSLLALAACHPPDTRRPMPTRTAVSEEARHQERLAFERWIEQEMMFRQVVLDLKLVSAPLCDVTNLGFGFEARAIDSVGKEWRDLHAEFFQLKRMPRVAVISPSGPALAAGLRVGDEIAQADDRVMTGEEGDARALSRAMRRFGLFRGALKLKVWRDGRDLDITIPPQPRCDLFAVIEPGDAIDAYVTDTGHMGVTSGLMDFVADKNELAMVVGHEIAHRSRDAVVAREINEAGGALAGMVADILLAGVGVNTGGAFSNAGEAMGRGAYSPEFEAEADYIGLYLMAQAGYSIDQAPQFWRRLGSRAGAESAPGHARTHPSSAYRFLALEAAVAEIKAKRASGEPLIPGSRPK